MIDRKLHKVSKLVSCQKFFVFVEETKLRTMTRLKHIVLTFLELTCSFSIFLSYCEDITSQIDDPWLLPKDPHDDHNDDKTVSRNSAKMTLAPNFFKDASEVPSSIQSGFVDQNGVYDHHLYNQALKISVIKTYFHELAENNYTTQEEIDHYRFRKSHNVKLMGFSETKTKNVTETSRVGESTESSQQPVKLTAYQKIIGSTTPTIIKAPKESNRTIPRLQRRLNVRKLKIFGPFIDVNPYVVCTILVTFFGFCLLCCLCGLYSKCKAKDFDQIVEV